MTTHPPAPQHKRVVIVGAGFGGVAAAEGLAHLPVEVTLVDQHDYHTFKPLVYQVATALLNAEDVGRPVRALFQHQDNFTVRQATATRIDWEAHQLLLAESELVPFDYLVLAAGAAASYFGIPGAAENTFPLYSLPDALRVRTQMLNCFEAAERQPAMVDEGLLTFVIVGGGPTGVETAGALADLFLHVLPRDYPDLAVNKARVVLVEKGQWLLPFMQASLRTYARRVLEERKVEVRLGDAVTEVSTNWVRLQSGEELRTHTPIWAGGLQAIPQAKAFGLPQGKVGRIVVSSDLSVAAHPEVFVVGDLAQITADGHLLPQLAQPAIQAGHHAAHQIARRLMGEPGQPFHYINLGTMATIGRGEAVCEFPRGLTLQGPLAWIAWLGVHLTELSGIRNRLDVLTDWGWGILTHERAARISIDPQELEGRRREQPV